MSRKRASRASRVSHEDYDQLLLMLKDMEASAGSMGAWDQPPAAEQETGLPPGVYIDSSGNVNDRFLEAVLQDTEFPADDQLGYNDGEQHDNGSFDAHSPAASQRSFGLHTQESAADVRYVSHDDLTEDDVQDEQAEEGVEDEADEPLATGRRRDPYLHDDGLDEDFEELADEHFLPSELVDEESLRHAHVKHTRASLTRKVSDELNKGFRSSQQRLGSDRSRAIAEQKQARSLKLRLQGQAHTIRELERRLEQANEELATKDETIEQLRRRVTSLDGKLAVQQSQPVVVSRRPRSEESTKYFQAHIEGLEKQLTEQRAANKRLQELLRNMRHHAEEMKRRSEASELRVRTVEKALTDMRDINLRIRRDAKASITRAENEIQQLQQRVAQHSQAEEHLRLLRSRIMQFQDSNSRLMDDKRTLQEEVAKLRRQLEVQRTARQQSDQYYEREENPEEHWPRREERAPSRRRERQPERPTSAGARTGQRTRADSSGGSPRSSRPLEEHHPQPTTRSYSRLEQLYNRVVRANGR